MDNSTTSVITLLISGLVTVWGALIAAILYIRALHIKAEKKSEVHGAALVEASKKHQEDITRHKDEIVDITKKFTEVVTNVNSSIQAVDKTIETRNKGLEATMERNIRALDDLHKAVLQGTKK